ncbi:tRNA pseudouridine(55) synthase TruB [bacterium]|nr:tRNA pseudouridine(55) synthase TruB [bacterium]
MPAVSGILNINKPTGLTSRDVVNRVLWMLREETGTRKIKVGHCGTLDPLATGVLIVCAGSATRLVSTIQELPKTYRGTFRLGLVTDTDDVTGSILQETPVDPVDFTKQSIRTLLPGFTGRISQLPPRFSAVHVDGKRAYELARQGENVKLEPRDVDVYELSLERFACPEFELLIRCGSGTYVRSIGRDLGERLGCGATMTALERSAIGGFEIGSAIDIDSLESGNLVDRLQPLKTGVSHLRRLRISDEQAEQVRNGCSVPLDLRAIESATLRLPVEPRELRVALLDPNEDLIAIAGASNRPGQLQPHIVFRK